MPRPHVAEIRMQQILDAAAITLSRLGFLHTRMEDIAETAQLSKATIYLYFKSKDALLEAVLQMLFAPLVATFAALRQPDSTAQERVLHHTHMLFAAFASSRSLYPLFFEMFTLATREHPIQSQLASYFQHYHHELTQVIQEGIDRQEWETGNATVMATILVACIEGIVQLTATVPIVLYDQTPSQLIQAILISWQKREDSEHL